MDYYRRIDVAELEGDLLKAILEGNAAKIKSKYEKLTEAQKTLNDVVAKQLKVGELTDRHLFQGNNHGKRSKEIIRTKR